MVKMVGMDAQSRHRPYCFDQIPMGLTARIVGIGAVLGLVSAAISKELVIADQGKSDYSIVVAVAVQDLPATAKTVGILSLSISRRLAPLPSILGPRVREASAV